MSYRDRDDAGAQLAALLKVKNYSDPVVLALPRGGVPLGAIVARALSAPLDLLIVRKIGVPFNPEVAAGAIVGGEPPVIVWNEGVLRHASLSKRDFDEAIATKKQEIAARRTRFGPYLPHLSLEGKTAIIVDDGIATGATALAALRGLKQRKPARIVLAVPVAADDALDRLRPEVDEVVCPLVPDWFSAVGAFYDRFDQVSDDEVAEILKGFGPAPISR